MKKHGERLKKLPFVWRAAGVMLAAVVALTAVAAVTMVPAQADVLWGPDNNSFFDKNWADCEYVGRWYLVNGIDGYVTVRQAPDSAVEVENISNGLRFCVNYTWDDTWALGYCYAENDQGDWDYTWDYTEGWVELGKLALLYDDTAFREDHEAEFGEYDGSGDELKQVCLYSYPGGTYSGTLEEDRNYMAFADTFQSLYTDENGLRWTYVGYYMGRQNAWVCLDDPMNESLGTEEYRTAAQVRDQEEALIPAAGSVPMARTWLVWLVPVVLILAAAAVTAVIARKKRRKKAQ